LLLSTTGAEVFLENGGEHDIFASVDPKKFQFGKGLAVSTGFWGSFACFFYGAV
jgi:hypothetical protein